MVNLTEKEISVINEQFKYVYPFSKIGNKISDIINNLPETGTPVNAVNATKTLTISGVVLDGETVTIGDDVYEFAADVALTVSQGRIPVDINAHTTKATNTLTVDTNPTSGDTMTIGSKVFTFVPVGTANTDGEIAVEATLAATKTNIVAAINGTDHNDPHPLVSCGAFNVHVLTLTALIGGTSGNSIATTETFTANGNVFSGATLATGANCTAANAVTALVTAITAEDTQGVGAVDGAGDTVVLTADVAGTIGNDISIAETMSNGAFAGGATKLSGGVNGTVGAEGKCFVDENYFYVCVAENTVADKNWRRISVGSAY